MLVSNFTIDNCSKSTNTPFFSNSS